MKCSSAVREAVPREGRAAPVRSAELRFYAELNDFLPPDRRQRAFVHRYVGAPSLKDTIEGLGVPHTEVDLILVDGRSVDFDARLAHATRVAVFPVFESVDVGSLTRVRLEPLRVTRFVADVHLGMLARYLRVVGFDTVWRNDLDDDEIIDISVAEKRIILTRDRGVLRHRRVTHGRWLRAGDPLRQLDEVVRGLDLSRRLEPYTRCLECNDTLASITGAEAEPLVPPRGHAAHAEFLRCGGCGRVYRPGTHHREGLDAIVERAKGALD